MTSALILLAVLFAFALGGISFLCAPPARKDQSDAKGGADP